MIMSRRHGDSDRTRLQHALDATCLGGDNRFSDAHSLVQRGLTLLETSLARAPQRHAPACGEGVQAGLNWDATTARGQERVHRRLQKRQYSLLAAAVRLSGVFLKLSTKRRSVLYDLLH